MMVPISDRRKPRHLVRWCLAMFLCVQLCGCAGLKARDEGFPESDLSHWVQKARPGKKKVEYGSLSEKGRQIERDLNAQ
jgi:hypothetical protein